MGKATKQATLMRIKNSLLSRLTNDSTQRSAPNPDGV